MKATHAASCFFSLDFFVFNHPEMDLMPKGSNSNEFGICDFVIRSNRQYQAIQSAGSKSEMGENSWQKPLKPKRSNNRES